MASRSKPRRRYACAANEDVAVRNGRDVPGAAAEEKRGDQKMKKAPENRGLEVITWFSALHQGDAQTTSFSSEQPFSSGRLSWLRSSSNDSP